MPLTTQPLAHSGALDSLRTRLTQNVPPVERIGSIGIGAALVGYGLSRRSLGGLLIAAAGGALIGRGATGHCALYEKLGINSGQLNTERGVPGNKGIKVTQAITVNAEPREVYRFWRNLENLPRFIEHVQSVERIDDLRSHWVVKGPAGMTVEWNAAIVSDREGELIAWESLPGAEVQNAGSVRFDPAANGGTELKVTLQYNPPAGVIGAAVAKLFGEAPDQQLAGDLQRAKEMIESAPAHVA